MLSLPLPVRIFLCTQPADMRRSFDGLAQMVREFLHADPLSGHLFIFRSKRGDRLKLLYWDTDGLTIVLTRDLQGKRPDQMFYCTKLDWDARQILSTYACRWAIECTFENCKQFLGLEDPANRLPLAVQRTAPMALLLYSLVIVWFHQVGHRFLRFPHRPWYQSKQEPSFADLLTTLRRVSCEEKTQTLLPKPCRLKAWLTQITELLSRAG